MKKLEELGISPTPWMTWHSNRKRVKDSRAFAIADCDYENSEDIANARLIAAAPELYECLREALSTIAYTAPVDHAKWRAALAKAAGKEVAK